MKYVGNILYDLDLLNGKSKLVIFGAGICGRKILKFLDLNGAKQRVICFCDSKKSLRGRNVEGIPVYSIDKTILQYPEAEYLISGVYSKEMYQILKQRQIEKIHIIVG